MMYLNAEIFKITCELYRILKYAESDVDFILNLIRNFLKKIYEPFILSELENTVFPLISSDKSEDIRKLFEKNKDPFAKYCDKFKRDRIDKTVGLHVEPKANSILIKKGLKRKRDEYFN